LPLRVPRGEDGAVQPFAGFTWERRHLPLTTAARGEGSTTKKTENLGHAGLLESGRKYFSEWRSTTKAFLSDQGAGDRGSKKAPVPCFPNFGDAAEQQEVLNRVEQKLLSSRDPRAKDLVFLINALQQSGLLHLLFNALQEAIEATHESGFLEPLLKALTKVCGDKSYSERLLEKGFPKADRVARRLLHSYQGGAAPRLEVGAAEKGGSPHRRPPPPLGQVLHA
jgi:hypothetical protein